MQGEGKLFRGQRTKERKVLLLLLFLLSKLVAIPRKKLKSPWRRDDNYICIHQKNQFKLDVVCENGRFSSLFAAEDVSRGITSATPRQKHRTDDVKLFTNDRQKTKGNTKGHESKVKCKRDESLTKQSKLVETILLKKKHLNFAGARSQMNTTLE